MTTKKVTKMDFMPNGLAVIDPNGEYSANVVSVLGHRFSLVGGKVVDKYNGVTDDEVKAADHVVAEALEVERAAAEAAAQAATAAEAAK
jgi:hypothetical protein